jgi:5-formyltetrahydrofolate cyclo-ligase
VSDALAEEKRSLRRRLSARRRAVAPDEALRAARRIAERLLGEPALRTAPRIALYAALPDELPTRPLFEALAGLPGARLFPRALADGRLAFAPVRDWSELAPGRYGVLEPPAGAQAVALSEGDLVLVPGVAFDRAGHRLGRGGGFYDRAFPAGAPGGPRLWGIAYGFQLVDAVPHGPRDGRVEAVVTEDVFQRAGSGAR